MERNPAMQIKKPKTPCLWRNRRESVPPKDSSQDAKRQRTTTHGNECTGQEGADRLGAFATFREHLNDGKDLATEEDERQDDKRRQQVRKVGEVERAADDAETALDDDRVHGGRYG